VADPIRFYLDEHVPTAVAQGLRRRGVGVMTVVDAGLRSADDKTQLGFATAENRVFVTRDSDFLRLHSQGVSHAGIVYSPRRVSIGALVDGLCLIANAVAPSDIAGHVEFLP